MLHAGLDLSRKRLDFHLLDEAGVTVEVGAAPPDCDGVHGLVSRLSRHRQPVRAAIESMTGARFVHDQLELAGWDVEIADAQKVKGLAPLACKTDRIDAWVLAELSRRDLVPAIWLPDPSVRAERERARFRLHLVRHRSSLKQRVHATLLTHGKPCPVSDLFGVRGRELLTRLALPEPWGADVEASLRLIDELDREIDAIERDLQVLGADHRYVPLLTTIPGSPGCSPTRSRRRSATSPASPRRASSLATRGSARASTSPASPIAAARSPRTAPATCAGR
jgi:transposase